MLRICLNFRTCTAPHFLMSRGPCRNIHCSHLTVNNAASPWKLLWAPICTLTISDTASSNQSWKKIHLCAQKATKLLSHPFGAPKPGDQVATCKDRNFNTLHDSAMHSLFSRPRFPEYLTGGLRTVLAVAQFGYLASLALSCQPLGLDLGLQTTEDAPLVVH